MSELTALLPKGIRCLSPLEVIDTGDHSLLPENPSFILNPHRPPPLLIFPNGLATAPSLL